MLVKLFRIGIYNALIGNDRSVDNVCQLLNKPRLKKEAKHKFNYSIMRELNGGKQMKDVWESSLTKPSEKKCGKHPTQKPMEILEKIILASTDEGDLILDPFNGSGTTGIVANKLNRKYIGIEKEKEYLDLTIRRKEAEK